MIAIRVKKGSIGKRQKIQIRYNTLWGNYSDLIFYPIAKSIYRIIISPPANSLA